MVQLNCCSLVGSGWIWVWSKDEFQVGKGSDFLLAALLALGDSFCSAVSVE